MKNKNRTIGKYKFNENGICTNPDEAIAYAGKIFGYRIMVAENAMGWTAGFECGIQYQPALHVSGCGAHIGDAWQKKENAILVMAELINARLLNRSENQPVLQKAVKELLPLQELIISLKTSLGIQNSDTDNKQTIFSSPINNLQMAKQIADKSAQSGAGTSSMTMIPISSIIPSPTNKLHREPWELDEKKDPSFSDLILSITLHGIAQPVLVRPNEKPGMFYLVCGERRLTAARKAGVNEIPALVKALSDDEAFELQIIENLQRKDVHPLKEGESYQAYMDQKGATVDDLVAKFSKTKEYIMQRMSFNNLIPELKKDFYAAKMGPGHAALFSRLTEADQKVCFDKCKLEPYESAAGMYNHIEEIKDFISSDLMMELKNVAFSLTDKTLVLAAGSCADCLKRSGAGLFGDIKEKDRCFDKVCFKNKKETHTLNAVQDLVDNNPDTPVINMDLEATIPAVKKILDKAGIKVKKRWHDFDESEKTAKGAIKALCVAGAGAGKWYYIKVKKQKATLGSSPSTDGSVKPASTPLSQKIKQAELEISKINDDIREETTDLLQDKLFDFKPYKSPDPKPLTKYELAAFYMAVENEVYMDRNLTSLIAKLPVPKGVSPSDKGATVERFANMPKDMINYIMRCFLKQYANNFSDYETYLTFKMAEENTAINMEVIKAAAAKKHEKNLADAEKKLQDLKPDTAPGKGIKKLLSK